MHQLCEPLVVLILEDNPDDAKLLELTLKRSGTAAICREVETESEFVALLDPPPDLILADYSVPGFDAVHALQVLRERDLDVPLIVVTGTVTEEIVAASIQHGAADYLLKDRLGRLGSAVSRAVSDRKLRAEKRQAEEALRESERRFRLLFQSNPHPMWVYDLETLRFLEVNDAAIDHYGYSRDEFLARSIVEIQPAEQVPRLLASMHQNGVVLKNAGVWRHRRKGGGLIDVEISSHRIDLLGRPAVIVVAFDVTERHLLEEQLRQAQKLEAVGRLAGGVAHDFNNLLTVITGFSELLLDNQQPTPEQRELIDLILAAGESATALTRQLLAFSRREIVVPRNLDLNQTVDELGKMLRRLIGEDIVFATALGSNLGLVHADPGHIEQILMNLATNARDAMPTGGKLTVETANVDVTRDDQIYLPDVQPGPYVLLTVSDTGIGMDAAVQARIFEPFFTTKEVGKGTGLGLAVVYGIVKQSNGAIGVSSEVGRGTTFRIYLPRVDGSTASADAASERAHAPVGTETILIVEDAAPLRSLVRAALESFGYQVLEGASGEEAIEVAESYRGTIHLLLADIVMPGMNGWQVAKRLSRQIAGPRVILMSGYTDDVIVRHGVREAGLSFLQKPFTPSVLARKVREVLDRPS